jgi:LacI family transcriptional regulator
VKRSSSSQFCGKVAVGSGSVRGIAEALGVSPATVSRSLRNSPEVSQAVRLKVLAEARRLGYALPRRAVRTGRIGIVFFNETAGPKFSGYDAVIWAGVARGATALKYDVCVLDPLDRKPGEGFNAFAVRKGVEGLVVRVDVDTRHVCREIAGDGVSHVVVADRFEDERVSYVCCNSSRASRAAVEHLLNLGHRRIAACHNTVLDTDHRDRVEAYKAVLTDAGIEIDPDLVIAMNAEIGGGGAVFNRLMSLPQPPTAIFFADPMLTVGALRRALEVGVRVPDELSIIGVDDESVRKWTYPVFTAVCQDAADLGQQAGRWLCRRLSEQPNQRLLSTPLRLETEAFLEINQTTAPPPHELVRVTPTGQRILE